jgi:crossover junction endodeoxyribonuclease RuvC
MKLYLAARYSRREELLEYAAQLEVAGLEVTSRWLKGGHQVTEQQLLDDKALGERFASEDWDDLEKADVMIAFTEEPRSAPNRGGRHVELGLALALDMVVFVVGPRENVFHALADAEFSSWHDCFLALVEDLPARQLNLAGREQHTDMIIIGIDPGLSGAVAWLDGDGNYLVWDTPTAKDGRHRVYLLSEMRALLLNATVGVQGTHHVFIEKVHSMPKQGVASSFSFGDGYGSWKGLVAGLGMPMSLVTPQRWQKTMLDGMQGGKDASIIRALELFPKAELKRKKDHGRADALLIAEYGRRRVAP